MMKRIFCQLLILIVSGCLLTTALVACSGASSDGKTGEQGAVIEAFSSRNTTILPHKEAAPIIEALGEPQSRESSRSCGFEGDEWKYDYGSIQILTYPKDGVDYIWKVLLQDDTVETGEKLRIGAPESDVQKAYPSAEKKGNGYSLKCDGNFDLEIILKDGKVTNIKYSYNA